MSIPEQERYYMKLKALKYLYEDEYTQTEIAKLLNISRVTLGKLIEEGKKDGMIKFEIIDVRNLKSSILLEDKLRERFGLDIVRLVDTHSTDPDIVSSEIASTAAVLFSRTIKNGMKLSITWGRTLNLMVGMLPSDPSITDVTISTLVGASSSNPTFQPNVLAQRLISKYNGTVNILTAPFYCHSPETCSALKKDPQIENSLEMAKKADAALVGIGVSPVRGVKTLNDFPFEEETINSLVDNGAVGDICGRFYDIYGNPCEKGIGDRTINVTLEDIRNIPNVIGVGGGINKVRSLLGALNGHYINTLVTDSKTAEGVLSLADTIK